MIEKIKNDPDIYRGYQANIAMAFKDAFHNHMKLSKSKYPNKTDIHAISNNAAINFLNLLIS